MTPMDRRHNSQLDIKSKRTEIVRRKSARHSSRVKFLKNFLPFLCFTGIGLILSWPFIHKMSSTDDLIIPNEHKNVIKKNKVIRPKINSLDKNGQPFMIQATSAEHHNSAITSFHQPHSTFKSSDGRSIIASSRDAIHNKTDNLIHYNEDVQVNFDQNYTIQTPQADYNIEHKTIKGTQKIQAASASCVIDADQGFDADINDIKFKGHVVLNIVDHGAGPTDQVQPKDRQQLQQQHHQKNFGQGNTDQSHSSQNTLSNTIVKQKNRITENLAQQTQVKKNRIAINEVRK